MGISNRIVSYKKKNWGVSKYKPKKMINVSTDMTEEIMRTCRNLTQLSNIVSNIASELHYLIIEVNKTMSKTSTSIVNDLVNVCNLIAQNNSSLFDDMNNAKNSLSTCEVQLERYSK